MQAASSAGAAPSGSLVAVPGNGVSNSAAPAASQQPAAAAAAPAETEVPLAQTDSGALSWPMALQTVALLHAVPALAAVAIRAAFRPAGCIQTGAAGAAAGGSGAASWLGSWLSSNFGTTVDADTAAATAAGCTLAIVAWRHFRLPDTAGCSGSGDAGSGAGSSGGRDVSAATGGFGGQASGRSMMHWQAALAGCGWHRLKAALMASVIVQLSVMACIDWAAATAALLLITPWLCVARPLPRRKQSSVADRGSFLLLVLLSPWTLLGILGGLTAARNGSLLGGILHDVAGSGGATSILRLLAASPVLLALLFGVYTPAWGCCALIALAPAG